MLSSASVTKYACRYMDLFSMATCIVVLVRDGSYRGVVLYLHAVSRSNMSSPSVGRAPRPSGLIHFYLLRSLLCGYVLIVGLQNVQPNSHCSYQTALPVNVPRCTYRNRTLWNTPAWATLVTKFTNLIVYKYVFTRLSLLETLVLG